MIRESVCLSGIQALCVHSWYSSTVCTFHIVVDVAFEREFMAARICGNILFLLGFLNTMRKAVISAWKTLQLFGSLYDFLLFKHSVYIPRSDRDSITFSAV